MIKSHILIYTELELTFEKRNYKHFYWEVGSAGLFSSMEEHQVTTKIGARIIINQIHL